MKEAIGGTFIFQIVILFILLFTGYMCLSINHSKAFNVKNMIINTIERKEIVNLNNPNNDSAIEEIVSYLNQISYRTTGSCPNGYTGYNRNGGLDQRNSSFCLMRVNVSHGPDMPDMSYYRVVVFYKLDLPIFNSLFEFKLSGDTKILTKTIGEFERNNDGIWYRS